jgi:hypothetical protein
MAKLYKLQVELTPEQFKRITELQEVGALRTKKELLDVAFTLLKWAVQQKQDGNKIISRNNQTREERELSYPYLDQVTEKRDRDDAKPPADKEQHTPALV